MTYHESDLARTASNAKEAADEVTLVIPDSSNVPLDEESPLLASQSAVVNTNEVTKGASGWTRQPSVSLLIPPFLLYCLAVGAVSVPKLNVILNLICVQYHSDGSKPTQCQTPSVHAQLGRFMLYANVISGVLCAFTSPRYGGWSDSYGRTRVLAITATGMLLGDAITIIVALFPDKISVYWILLEFALGGLAGSFVATMAVAQSYAADCTTFERRGVVFGRLYACVYIGAALGPAVGSFCIRVIGHGNVLTIFYAAGVCHLTFVLYVLFLLPESLPPEARRLRPKATADIVEAGSRSLQRQLLRFIDVLRPLSIFRPSADEASPRVRRNLVLLAAIDTVAFGVTLGTASLQVIYPEFRFGWTSFEAGLLVSLVNATRALMLTTILPVASRVVTRQRRQRGEGAHTESFYLKAIRISVLFDVIGYMGLAIAPTPLLFCLASVLATVGAIALPSLQSVLTTHVAPGRTGELLGAVSLLHALARLSLPALLHLIYSLTIESASTMVFWTLTLTFGFAFVASLWLRPRRVRNEANE